MKVASNSTHVHARAQGSIAAGTTSKLPAALDPSCCGAFLESTHMLAVLAARMIRRVHAAVMRPLLCRASSWPSTTTIIVCMCGSCCCWKQVLLWQAHASTPETISGVRLSQVCLAIRDDLQLLLSVLSWVTMKPLLTLS